MGWTNGQEFQVWPCSVNGIPFNLGLMICFDREVPESALLPDGIGRRYHCHTSGYQLHLRYSDAPGSTACASV